MNRIKAKSFILLLIVILVAMVGCFSEKEVHLASNEESIDVFKQANIEKAKPVYISAILCILIVFCFASSFFATAWLLQEEYSKGYIAMVLCLISFVVIVILLKLK